MFALLISTPLRKNKSFSVVQINVFFFNEMIGNIESWLKFMEKANISFWKLILFELRPMIWLIDKLHFNTNLQHDVLPRSLSEEVF